MHLLISLRLCPSFSGSSQAPLDLLPCAPLQLNLKVVILVQSLGMRTYSCPWEGKVNLENDQIDPFTFQFLRVLSLQRLLTLGSVLVTHDGTRAGCQPLQQTQSTCFIETEKTPCVFFLHLIFFILKIYFNPRWFGSMDRAIGL